MYKTSAFMTFNHGYIRVRYVRWYFYSSCGGNNYLTDPSSLRKWNISFKCMSFDTVVSIGHTQQMWWIFTRLFNEEADKNTNVPVYRAFTVSCCWFILVVISKCYRLKETEFELKKYLLDINKNFFKFKWKFFWLQ